MQPEQKTAEGIPAEETARDKENQKKQKRNLEDPLDQAMANDQDNSKPVKRNKTSGSTLASLPALGVFGCLPKPGKQNDANKKKTMRDSSTSRDEDMAPHNVATNAKALPEQDPINEEKCKRADQDKQVNKTENREVDKLVSKEVDTDSQVDKHKQLDKNHNNQDKQADKTQSKQVGRDMNMQLKKKGSKAEVNKSKQVEKSQSIGTDKELNHQMDKVLNKWPTTRTAAEVDDASVSRSKETNVLVATEIITITSAESEVTATAAVTSATTSAVTLPVVGASEAVAKSPATEATAGTSVAVSAARTVVTAVNVAAPVVTTAVNVAAPVVTTAVVPETSVTAAAGTQEAATSVTAPTVPVRAVPVPSGTAPIAITHAPSVVAQAGRPPVAATVTSGTSASTVAAVAGPNDDARLREVLSLRHTEPEKELKKRLVLWQTSKNKYEELISTLQSQVHSLTDQLETQKTMTASIAAVAVVKNETEVVSTKSDEHPKKNVDVEINVEKEEEEVKAESSTMDDVSKLENNAGKSDSNNKCSVDTQEETVSLDEDIQIKNSSARSIADTQETEGLKDTDIDKLNSMNSPGVDTNQLEQPTEDADTLMAEADDHAQSKDEIVRAFQDLTSTRFTIETDGDSGDRVIHALSFNRDKRRAIKYSVKIPAEAGDATFTPTGNVQYLPEFLQQEISFHRDDVWVLFSKILRALH